MTDIAGERAQKNKKKIKIKIKGNDRDGHLFLDDSWSKPSFGHRQYFDLVDLTLLKQAQEGNSRVRLQMTNKTLRNVEKC